jgi:maleylpyruvate isomerase
MPPDDIAELVHDARASTARFLLGLGSLTGQDVARPSLLPGWTVGHVLSHVARNADAMVRTLGGALRGEPTPMYPEDARFRAADIEAGAGRPLPEQVEDLRASAHRLDEAWRAMTPEAWDREAMMRAGSVPAWRTVIARWVEVELHWVDLDRGYHPDGWPEAFTGRLLPMLTGRSLADRVPAALRLVSTDTGQQWSVGDGSPVVVRGPAWALACWLSGRTAPAQPALAVTGADVLPTLSPWL